MTEEDHQRHLHRAKTLKREGPPGAPTRHLWLLVPEGMPVDADLMAISDDLRCNGVVRCANGRLTPLHMAAQADGLDVSVPVLYWPPVEGEDDETTPESTTKPMRHPKA